MLPVIPIGPAILPTGPITLIIGIWLSLSLVERSARRLSLDSVTTYSLASTGIIAGIVGARLTFVFLHWSAYSSNLIGIIWPINVGFNLWGGIIFGLLGAIFYGRARQVPVVSTLDALAPGLLVGLLFFSLSDFLAGPGYGENTTLPWGISQFGLRRHPVQLYEIAISLGALAVWFWQQRRVDVKPGQPVLSSLAVYSAGIIIADAFRATAWLTSNGFHIVQIIALLVGLTCLVLLARLSEPAEAQTPPD
jgi:phosphatidylglycerol:prolipoprotein diacylglycerol transferase